MVIRVARNLFSLVNIYSDKLLGSLTAAEVYLVSGTYFYAVCSVIKLFSVEM